MPEEPVRATAVAWARQRELAAGAIRVDAVERTAAAAAETRAAIGTSCLSRSGPSAEPKVEQAAATAALRSGRAARLVAPTRLGPGNARAG